MKYDPERHRRRSMRLKGYVEWIWCDLPNYVGNVRLGAFAVVSDHVGAGSEPAPTWWNPPSMVMEPAPAMMGPAPYGDGAQTTSTPTH